MPWVKIDDNFYDHLKITAVGLEATAVFVLSLSFSARQLSDGFIPELQARRFAIAASDPQGVIDRLVKEKLWERVDGGYQIHDYLEYNPSAAKVKAERKAAAERQAKWRDQHSTNGDGGESDEKSNGMTNGVTDTHPVPVPVPVPDQESSATPGAGAPTPKPPPDTGKKSKSPTPEAVKVFRSVVHRYPAKSWYSEIDSTVGADDAALELWGKVAHAWVGLGWNPTNVKGMLECYRNGEIPGAGNGRAGPGKRTIVDENLEMLEAWVQEG